MQFEQDGRVVSDPDDIVAKFNDFFVNIGKNISSKIPSSLAPFSSFLKNPISSFFTFDSCDPDEIVNIVKNFSGKDSFGYDMIPTSLVKCCINQISEPLSALVNRSFQTGLFSDQLKIAKVVPLFKGGNISSFENYRPISLLPCFSKILEKAAFSRIQTWLDTNNIISASQFGFHAKHSTYMALLDMCRSVSTR